MRIYGACIFRVNAVFIVGPHLENLSSGPEVMKGFFFSY